MQSCLSTFHAGAVGTAWISPDQMNKLSTGARNSLQGLRLLRHQWNEMADLEIGFSAPPCRGNLIREVLCASFDKNRNEFQRKCLAGPSSEQRTSESKRCWGVEICSVLRKTVVSVVPEGCDSHGEALGGRRVVGEDRNEPVCPWPRGVHLSLVTFCSPSGREPGI